jgi:hypothetical protein
MHKNAIVGCFTRCESLLVFIPFGVFSSTYIYPSKDDHVSFFHIKYALQYGYFSSSSIVCPNQMFYIPFLFLFAVKKGFTTYERILTGRYFYDTP